VDDLVELILEIRENARDAGEFERADGLRAALDEVGVEVEDGPDGPTYRYR
jgi:cysteinyl-tRNA synthetase